MNCLDCHPDQTPAVAVILENRLADGRLAHLSRSHRRVQIR